MPETPGLSGLQALGASLPFIGGMYDTYHASKVSRENTDKTIAHQKREAELAYQREVEMWHMQNAYNSPSEQMQRFGAAGLNPHLIYGQGSAGNSTSTPHYSPPNVQYKYAAPSYGDSLTAMLPMMMQVGSWMQNMRSQEIDIQRKEFGVQEAELLVNFIKEKYPHEVRAMGQKESLWDYQRDAAYAGTHKARVQVADALEEFRYKWGAELDAGYGPYEYSKSTGSGSRHLEALLKSAQGRLTGAQADWFEPATIMKLVGAGLLGLLPFGKMLGGASRVAPRAAGSAKKFIDKVRTTTRKNRAGTDTYKKYYYRD